MSFPEEHLTTLENHDELDVYRQALDCTNDLVWLWDVEQDLLTIFGKTFSLLSFKGEKSNLHLPFGFHAFIQTSKKNHVTPLFNYLRVK
ncbi:MAG: hypothetical protein A6F71_08890 [Cycloclasticus sp. symbiont of Poecilosclerida sp. M]|nr:MAG: hypothetical protein A6F71_08890 [Cycloclasticus sp. symbiont of Poecilosclerida sp. M]